MENAAFKDALSVVLVQKHIETDTNSIGGLSEFLALSAYAQRGYDNEWIERIKTHAVCREDGPNCTYALRVGFEKSQKDFADITQSIRAMIEDIKESGIKDKKRKAEKCDDNDDSSHSPSCLRSSSKTRAARKKCKKGKKGQEAHQGGGEGEDAHDRVFKGK